MQKNNTIKYTIGFLIGLLLVFSLFLPQCIGTYSIDAENGDRSYMDYDPKSYDFGNKISGEEDSTVFYIWKAGGCCAITYEITEQCQWIVDINPSSGSSNGEHDPITVTISTEGLAINAYHYPIQITTNENDAIFDVYVNVVDNPDPTLAYEPDEVDFGFMLEGTVKEVTFDVWNEGAGILTYSLSEECDWFSVDPDAGESNGVHDTITVTANTAGLGLGVHTGEITIDSNGGSATIPVRVEVVESIPELRVESITGGVGKVNAVLKNVGTVSGSDIDWTITVTGGILQRINVTTEGTIDVLGPGEVELISTDQFIAGFGGIQIQIEAFFAENAVTDGFVFFFLVF